MDAVNSYRDQMKFSIELDCPPSGIRPGDLIGKVIEGTGLPIREPIAKSFGNWAWSYTDIPGIDELWPKIQPTLRERIEVLYKNGTIRYGSW